MPLGPLIVMSLRLLVPLSILRWPLVGGIVTMLLDAVDVVLITLIGQGDFADYHMIDKWMDMYYLTIELWVALKWKHALARNTAAGLFVYRIMGFVGFELTHTRLWLFIFPNLFENFFLFYLIYCRYWKPETLKIKNLILWLGILLVPKMAQEYVLHFAQMQPWVWISTTFFGVKWE